MDNETKEERSNEKNGSEEDEAEVDEYAGRREWSQSEEGRRKAEQNDRRRDMGQRERACKFMHRIV